MYSIINGPSVQEYELRLNPRHMGFLLYTFTFSAT